MRQCPKAVWIVLTLIVLCGIEAGAETPPAEAPAEEVMAEESMAEKTLSPEEKEARELAAAVSRMSQIGNTWSPTFSPDGEHLAVVSMLSGQTQLWVMETEGSWPVQLTGHSDGVMAAEWSPTGDWIAYSVPPGGGGSYQIELIEPRSGAESRRITPDEGETNFMNQWTPDGKGFVYSSNRRHPEHMDLYMYHLETGEIEMLLESEGFTTIDDISEDGRYALLAVSKARSAGTLHLLDLETRTHRPLVPGSEEAWLSDGEFSPDGKHAYFISDADRDLSAVVRVEVLEGGVPGPPEVFAERAGSEVERYRISPDGRHAAVVWNFAGGHLLEFVDLATKEHTPAPTLPVESMFELQFSRDGELLALMLSGAAAPTDIWIYDLAKKEYRRVTSTPHPGVDLTEMVRPELIEFPSHDGLKISGWLYRAADNREGPGPLALSIHGGPESQEVPSFRTLYQALLSRGISIFAPNIRGSAGFGKKFLQLDDGGKRFDALGDVKACVDEMIRRGVADPEAIGVFGQSYGGYMALLALTAYPDIFKVGASISGIVNFDTFFDTTEPWIAALSKSEYGDPAKDGEILRRLSPMQRIDRLRVPMVLAHGVNDDNVPVSEADQVAESLKRRGIPYKYLRFPDEGHAIRIEENRIAFEAAIVQFFKKYLVTGDQPGDELPSD